MKTFFAILVFFAVMFLVSNANSQGLTCAPRTGIIENLKNKYEESPVAMGLVHNGGVIEIFATKTGDTWTAIITMPDGMTCMVTSGESWEFLPPKDEGKNGV